MFLGKSRPSFLAKSLSRRSPGRCCRQIKGGWKPSLLKMMCSMDLQLSWESKYWLKYYITIVMLSVSVDGEQFARWLIKKNFQKMFLKTALINAAKCCPPPLPIREVSKRELCALISLYTGIQNGCPVSTARMRSKTQMKTKQYLLLMVHQNGACAGNEFHGLCCLIKIARWNLEADWRQCCPSRSQWVFLRSVECLGSTMPMASEFRCMHHNLLRQTDKAARGARLRSGQLALE